MAFTKALYYPWIEVQNEGWLKNAFLYWDLIQTIVPESLSDPYKTEICREFYDEGMLVPCFVSPEKREVRDLTKKVLKYMASPEGAEILMPQSITGPDLIHFEKMPEEVREIVEIHNDKLSEEIRSRIHTIQRDEDWLIVDRRFADFYMTLLAAHISEEAGIGLLTDKLANNKLANKAKLDTISSLSEIQRHQEYYNYNNPGENVPSFISQGILADLMFEKIQIDPETPVKKIIKFRKERADDLGLFRTKIAELTSSITKDLPPEALHQTIEDIYKNEVQPSVSTLKRQLTDHRIKWATENFLKVGFFSTSSTSVPLLLVGMATSLALLVGAGISLTASLVMYNREKEAKLRENPFSYLLAVEKKFS